MELTSPARPRQALWATRANRCRTLPHHGHTRQQREGGGYDEATTSNDRPRRWACRRQAAQTSSNCTGCCTSMTRSLRMAATTARASTRPVASRAAIHEAMATMDPDRPTPALQCTTTGPPVFCDGARPAAACVVRSRGDGKKKTQGGPKT